MTAITITRRMMTKVANVEAQVSTMHSILRELLACSTLCTECGERKKQSLIFVLTTTLTAPVLMRFQAFLANRLLTHFCSTHSQNAFDS